MANETKHAASHEDLMAALGRDLMAALGSLGASIDKVVAQRDEMLETLQRILVQVENANRDGDYGRPDRAAVLLGAIEGDLRAAIAKTEGRS